MTQYPTQPQHNPQPSASRYGPGVAPAAPASPSGQTSSAREVAALLLLAALVAQMFAALISLGGRLHFRLAILNAWGDFLGFQTLLLIGLAVAIGIGTSPGPRARAIGTIVVVLLGVALVFGLLFGLPSIFISSPGSVSGLVDGFGRFVVFLASLAMYAALVLYVRSVLAKVSGVPLFGPSRSPLPQTYGQPPAYGQAQAQQYGQSRSSTGRPSSTARDSTTARPSSTGRPSSRRNRSHPRPHPRHLRRRPHRPRHPAPTRSRVQVSPMRTPAVHPRSGTRQEMTRAGPAEAAAETNAWAGPHSA